MWAITSSPLIYSSDLNKTTSTTLAVLTNRAAIAINQQYAGNAGDLLKKQGRPVYFCVGDGMCLVGGEGEVWYKPLPGGESGFAGNPHGAPALLNPQGAAKNATTVDISVTVGNFAVGVNSGAG